MVVDDEAKRFLAAKGYDVQFGARPLKRAIQNYLEDGLSELIVSAGLQPGDTVNVSVDKEKDELYNQSLTSLYNKTVKMSVLRDWHFFCVQFAKTIKIQI